jgi:hypothetical protein
MVAIIRLHHFVGTDQLRVHLAQRTARAAAGDASVIDAVSLLERAQPVSSAAGVNSDLGKHVRRCCISPESPFGGRKQSGSDSWYCAVGEVNTKLQCGAAEGGVLLPH